MKCTDCPRHCETSTPFCGKISGKIRIGKAVKFFLEEPIICPKDTGCGAVFFSYCSLKCVYCQNYELSKNSVGRDITKSELTKLLKMIDNSNVENIDLVTPTHYTGAILRALKTAKVKKSVIWNSSGYDTAENIRKMRGLVDIFLFDVKYFHDNLALKYSKAKNYFATVISAIKTARALAPDVIENGVMKRGVIIRHLVLPTHINDSKKIFDEISREIGTDVYVSLMSQYTPIKDIDCAYAHLNRPLKKLEYSAVVQHIKTLGFKKGYIQEMSSATCDYVPEFNGDIFLQFEPYPTT